jgi:hypothetical protein
VAMPRTPTLKSINRIRVTIGGTPLKVMCYDTSITVARVSGAIDNKLAENVEKS